MLPRALVLAVAFLAALGGPAQAAGFQDVGGPDDGARCLRTTGAPGQLLLQAPAARGFATDVRQDGHVVGTVRLGVQAACAEGASGGGRLLVAAPVATRGGRFALRASSGPGEPPQTLAATGPRTALSALAVAVGARGDAAVAWAEQTELTQGQLEGPIAIRVRVARAAPGRGLSAPETVWSRSHLSRQAAQAEVALGLDRDGTLTLVTGEPTVAGRAAQPVARLTARTAARGARLGAPEVLDRVRQDALEPDVSVAPDGSALVAAGGAVGVDVWARGPGQRSFARVVSSPAFGDTVPRRGIPVVARISGDPQTPAVVVGDGSRGAVAWRSDDGSAWAVALTTGFRPGALRRILAPASDDDQAVAVSRLSTFAPEGLAAGAPIPDFADLRPVVALGPAEQVVVGVLRAGGRDGDAVVAATAAGTLANGVGEAVAVTGPARSALRVALVPRPDGSVRAWVADEAGLTAGDGVAYDATAHPRGRLTPVVAAPPAGPPPAARLIGPATVAVRGVRPFRVRVRCEAACDVRAVLRPSSGPAGDDFAVSSVAGEALDGPGTAVLEMVADPQAGRDRRPELPLEVQVSAPGGLEARALTRTVRVRRLALLPAPVVRVLAVRRTASRAVLTLAVPRGLGRVTIGASDPDSLAGLATVRARGGRLRLVVPVARASRAVTVFAATDDPGRASREFRVRLPPA